MQNLTATLIAARCAPRSTVSFIGRLPCQTGSADNELQPAARGAGRGPAPTLTLDPPRIRRPRRMLLRRPDPAAPPELQTLLGPVLPDLPAQVHLLAALAAACGRAPRPAAERQPVPAVQKLLTLTNPAKSAMLMQAQQPPAVTQACGGTSRHAAVRQPAAAVPKL